MNCGGTIDGNHDQAPQANQDHSLCCSQSRFSPIKYGDSDFAIEGIYVVWWKGEHGTSLALDAYCKTPCVRGTRRVRNQFCLGNGHDALDSHFPSVVVRGSLFKSDRPRLGLAIYHWLPILATLATTKTDCLDCTPYLALRTCLANIGVHYRNACDQGSPERSLWASKRCDQFPAVRTRWPMKAETITTPFAICGRTGIRWIAFRSISHEHPSPAPVA